MFKGVEIFRAGEHVSSEGVRKAYTESDLDRIAAYDSSKHEAPVVVGHPASNAPAYGWVGKVWRQGGRLLADFSDVDPDFADLVKSGRFKKRSISLYPDGTLRHVGFLGAVPPAIKGLKDVSFAEGEALTFDFEDGRVSGIVGVLVNLRDWIIDQFGADTANNIMDSDDLGQLLDTPSDDNSNIGAEDTAFKEEDMAAAEINKQLESLTGQMAQFSEQLKAKDKQIADLEASNKSLSAKLDATGGSILNKDLAQFCEAHLTRILPANRARAMAIMTTLANSKPVNFAEEGKDPADVSPLKLFQEMVSCLPVQVTFGEHATRARAGNALDASDAQAMATKIRDKRDAAHKAGRAMSFAEAQAEVLKEGQK
jgi:hypothetical protein